jgi:hypothetical protein
VITMADTTTTASPDTNAGHVGATTTPGKQSNLAPADQKGYDPSDAKWSSVPGAAARANGFPRLS